MLSKSLKALTGADTMTVRQSPDDSGRKKRYYVEYTSLNANGDVDTGGQAGASMKVEGRLHGQGGWQEISASTSINTGGAYTFENFAGAYESLRFTPSNLDTDHSITVFVVVVDD